MGIRPSINVVFGIDNLKTRDYDIIDPRFSGKVDYEEWDNPLDLPAKSFESVVLEENLKISNAYHYLFDWNNDKPKSVNDVLVWDSEYGLPNIIGMKVAKTDRDNLGWFFSSVDDKYSQDGYSICKSYKFEEITVGKTIKLVCDHLKEQGKPVFPYLRRILKEQPDIRERHKFCKHGQLYPHHDYIQTRMWIDAVQILFDKIGLKVDDKDLKLMLYWSWGWVEACSNSKEKKRP